MHSVPVCFVFVFVLFFFCLFLFFILQLIISRSSRLEVLCKKCSWKFRNICRKILLLESLFNKVAGFLYQKETPTQVLFCKYCKISKNTFFYITSPVATSAFLEILTWLDDLFHVFHAHFLMQILAFHHIWHLNIGLLQFYRGINIFIHIYIYIYKYFFRFVLNTCSDEVACRSWNPKVVGSILPCGSKKSKQCQKYPKSVCVKDIKEAAKGSLSEGSQSKSVYCYSNTVQKMKFPLGISSVNVTKSAISCGFGHI